MNFDSLVTRVELSLLPIVRKEKARLRTSGRYSEVEIVSLRHADAIHAIGIACRPVWASEELERLSLTAALMGFEGLSGRIDVQWSQVFMPSTGSGYLKKETGGFQSDLNSESEIARFEEKWSRLLNLFRKVVMRG